MNTELMVQSKHMAADGVAVLTLTDPHGRELPPWTPGAHVDVVLAPGLVRQYSLCGDPGDRHAWRVAVLREQNGSGGSRFVHESLQAGARIEVRGPRNHFPLTEADRYLFIAGGIGITPIIPMLEAVEAAGKDWRLLYGGRRLASMAFHEELLHHGDRVQIHPEDTGGLLPLESVLGLPEEGTAVYCCGPESLLRAVDRACAPWPEGTLRVERFHAAEAVASSGSVDPFDVHLKRSGMTLTVPPDKSILEVLEEAGVEVLSSCRTGTCGTCETEVLDGVPDHRDSVLTSAERTEGALMMVCLSRAQSPRLVLDL